MQEEDTGRNDAGTIKMQEGRRMKKRQEDFFSNIHLPLYCKGSKG